MKPIRACVVAILLASITLVGRAARTSDLPPVDLEALPYAIGDRTGADAGPLDADTVRILGADAYLNRTYAESAAAPIGLYIAYYSQQRPGVSLHSPLHCLPGTGWESIDVATLPIARPDGAAGSARRLVVRKNLDRAVVLYWYSVHGRMVANEVASKAFLLGDSLWLHRSDAALVRLVIPFKESPDAAARSGAEFAHDLLPFLARLWS